MGRNKTDDLIRIAYMQAANWLTRDCNIDELDSPLSEEDEKYVKRFIHIVIVDALKKTGQVTLT